MSSSASSSSSSGKKKRYPCPKKECKTSFTSEATLRNHTNNHHHGMCIPGKVNTPCPYCHFKFGTDGGTINHVRAVHDQHTYKCPFPGCNKEYRHVDSIMKHIMKEGHVVVK